MVFIIYKGEGGIMNELIKITQSEQISILELLEKNSNTDDITTAIKSYLEKMFKERAK